MDPREFCREGGFPRALLLTYAFDPLFFERIVLRDLWHGGTGDVLVVADERPVAEDLPRWRGEVGQLGRRYHLASVGGGGAFHPKLVLRVGTEGGIAWIGSGNVTFGGWGANRELAAAWRVGGDAEDAGAWIAPLLDGLRLRVTGGAVAELVDSLRETTWIDQAVEWPGDIGVLHTLVGETPLIERLAERWRGRRFARARLFTGSTDREGKLLAELAERFGVGEALVVGSPGRIAFDPDALARLPLEVDVKIRPDWPPVHAKLLWLDGEDGAACVFGSANASSAAWHRTASTGGNAELVVAFDQPDAEAFEDVLGAFNPQGLIDARLTTASPEEKRNDAIRPPVRVGCVEWEATETRVAVELLGKALGDLVVEIEEGERRTALERESPGRWEATWSPVGMDVTSVGFVTVVVHEPDGAEHRFPSWVHDLAELRHASRGRSADAAIRGLGTVGTPSEQRRVLEALSQISIALIAEPGSFPDFKPRGADTASKGDSEGMRPVDPARLLRSLKDVDAQRPQGRAGVGQLPLTMIGVLRVLFASARSEDPTSAEGEAPAASDGPDTGEDPPGAPSPSQPKETYRKRLRKQMETFLDELASPRFAEHATALQLVQAAAYPLAVAKTGHDGGWVDAEDAVNWTVRVFAVLFEREGPDGTIGLLEQVQHRFRSTGLEDVFLKTVGDGTLWMALLMSLAELPQENMLGGLRRALALRAVHDRRALIASGEAGRMRSLLKRLDERRARGLVEMAPQAVAILEELDSHLASREERIRTAQSVATFLHNPGDLLWANEIGWAECQEKTAGGGNGRIFSHWSAREMTVRMSTYVNATQVSKSDPKLADLLQALLRDEQPDS